MVTETREELRKNMGGTTIMYSIESRPQRDKKSGRKTGKMKTVIVEHHFPWDRNSKYSAPKFQRMLARGFTFEKPAINAPMERNELRITDVIAEPKTDSEAPLYVSDKDRLSKRK